MYSGITQGLFPVISLNRSNNFLDYSVQLSPELINKLKVGDSVSVDGVCQTVVSINGENVQFHAIWETLSRTTLNDLTLKSMVSIERSMCLGDEIGGHEVSGHIFGTGVISQVLKSNENLSLVIHCDELWMKYILPKGFIAIDGSSLTIGETDPKRGLFSIHLIPETQRVTNFKTKQINDKVNIEFDHKTKTIVDTVERVLSQLDI
ncbi:MAG: riboflavin synthase subunit alpha [Legionellaceae bacterium]|nr:riboflavin synthase subunit alpha [Legionellaceae bacterium]